MADKIKTDKQSGGVNVGGDAKAHNIIGRDYRVTVISVGAAFIIMAGIAAIVLLSPVLNKPPIPPAPTPTPLAFQPAGQDETLLIVADFDDRSAGQYAGIDPAQRIYELITDKLPGSNMKLRVEQYHHLLKDSAEARRILNQYGATLLIWGWYDKLGAEPNVELDKERIALTNPQMHEVSLATPESFVVKFTQEIPSQSAYVAFFSLGMMQLDLDRVAAAAFLTQAIDSASRVSADSVNPWEALMWRGNIYQLSREYTLALTDYSTALKLHPHREGYNNRALSYTMLGKYDEAIADCTKAIEIDPKYRDAYFNRAIAYASQGKHDEEIADYTKAIEIDPKYRDAYFNRAAAYTSQGKRDEGIADYTRAIGIDPKYRDAYFNRAIAYASQGEYDEAIADCSEAIAIDPQYVSAYQMRGIAYMESMKYSQAIADYKKSIGLKPEPYTYCLMGIAYTKAGDFSSAIVALEQGIKLDSKSDYPWCKMALDNLQLGTPSSNTRKRS